jgi:hypothetical protein
MGAPTVVLSADMVRALEAAAAGTLVGASNHPSIRFLRKVGYLMRGAIAGKRGRISVWGWRITEEGRERLRQDLTGGTRQGPEG